MLIFCRTRITNARAEQAQADPCESATVWSRQLGVLCTLWTSVKPVLAAASEDDPRSRLGENTQVSAPRSSMLSRRSSLPRDFIWSERAVT